MSIYFGILLVWLWLLRQIEYTKAPAATRLDIAPIRCNFMHDSRIALCFPENTISGLSFRSPKRSIKYSIFLSHIVFFFLLLLIYSTLLLFYPAIFHTVSHFKLIATSVCEIKQEKCNKIQLTFSHFTTTVTNYNI